MNLFYRKLISTYILLCFFLNIALPPSYAQELFLPVPGTMVHLSPTFNPPILKGIKVYPNNPFVFDFILDNGDQKSNEDEASKLVKYFLASLTTPENDMWVNLSPYEKDRIVPESFGQTEMGRDLLAQDYLLKQITASLIYPEDEVGKKFWERIRAEAKKKFGTSEIPVNTFNKVWIVPAKAVVYENPQSASAYVVDSKLKVMLEEDYVALSKQKDSAKSPAPAGDMASSVIREIVIPALTKEVNEGKNFAQLRQVYNSLILAAWYKKKIRDSILSQVYIDKNKVAGVNIDDPNQKQVIYDQYLEAFKKGAYNYIKEEYDPATEETIPKKYFSGGFSATAMDMKNVLLITASSIALSNTQPIKDADSIRVQIASAAVQEPLRVRITAKDLKAFGLKYDDMGGQAAVFTKDDWPFVIKVLHGIKEEEGDREQWERGYQLAQERLGGVAEDLAVFDLQKNDGTWQKAVVMRKVPRNLKSQISIMSQQEDVAVPVESIKKYIDANIQLIVTSLYRGVFPDDVKFDNFGIEAQSSRERIIDPGTFKDNWNSGDILALSQILEANRIFLQIFGDDLSQYYLEQLNKFGLGDNIIQTISRIWKTEEFVAMDEIWAEVEASFNGQVAVKYPKVTASSGAFNSAVLRTAPLTYEARQRIAQEVDAVIDDLRSTRIRFSDIDNPNYQHTFFAYTDEIFDSRMKRMKNYLLANADPAESRFFAQTLAELWKLNGFDRDFGSVFEFAAIVVGESINVPGQVKKNYQWLYDFLEAAPPLQKALALRLSVLSFSNHLRNVGLHPENRYRQYGLTTDHIPVDQETFFGNDSDAQGPQVFARYISSLLELQKTPLWKTVILDQEGKPNVAGVTYEEVFLWALILAIDPTVHSRTIQGYKQDQLEEYLTSYFGSQEPVKLEKAGVKFLERGFKKGFSDDVLRMEVEPLLIRAFELADSRRTPYQSPYFFSSSLQFLRLILEQHSFWQNPNLRMLGNPMLAIGFKNQYIPESLKEDFSFLEYTPIGQALREMNGKGLKSYYVSAFTELELQRIFPELAEILTAQASSSLDVKVKKDITAKADLFVAKLIGWQKERPVGHKYYEQTVYRYYEENIADLMGITDPEQITYLAQILNERWKASGLERDLGSVFAVISLQFGTQIVEVPSVLRSNYQWIYNFLEAAPLREKTQALWLLVMSTMVHLRYLGLHPESEKAQSDWISNEAFPLDHAILVGDGSTQDVGLMPRFLSSLAELSEKEPDFIKTKMAPGKSDLTYEDLYLWGLVFAMDPTVYFRSGNWDAGNLAQKERSTRFLTKYFGLPTDERNAHVRFLSRVFGNPQVVQKWPLIEPLIKKALSVTDEEWIAKKLRSPYGYEFSSVYFRLAFENELFWEAKDEVRLLGDPMWAIALDLNNFRDERLRFVLSRSPEQRFPKPTMPAMMLRRAYSITNYEEIATAARASTAIDDAASFFIGLLARQRNQYPDYQSDFFKAQIVQEIIEKLGGFTDPGQIKYLATTLQKKWKQRRFDEDFGSLYSFMAVIFAESLADSPEQVEKNYEWLYNFFDAATASEKALAYWTLMISVSGHLRNQGVHPETPGSREITSKGNSYPVDHEILVAKSDRSPQVFQRYFLSLFALTPGELNTVMTSALDLQGKPNTIKITLEDLMLWAAVLAVDPTIYQHSQYLSQEDLREFYRRYWNEDVSTKEAALKFVRQAINHPALAGKASEIKEWIAKAFARTDSEWEALGMKSPFKYIVRNSRLVRVLLNETFWNNPSRRLVKEPVLLFSLQTKYFPEVLQDRFLPDPQQPQSNQIMRSHPEGLRELYEVLEPELASSALVNKRERELDAIADNFMTDLIFGPNLRQITQAQEMKYLARAINTRWNAAGLDKKIGPFFTFLAINYSEEYTPIDPNDSKQNHQWVYQFLEAADPLERNDALWAMVVSNSAHLRRLGLHPEESPALVFLDQELLLSEGGLLQRYIASFEELTPEQLSQRIKGPEGSDFSRKDLLLWGLLLALDPTTYSYSLDMNDAQLNKALGKYFGDKTTTQTAAARFISRAFENQNLKSKHSKIEDLLTQAFAITREEWEAKGLRSPYEFGLQQIYLKILLKTESVAEAIALTGVENPVVGFALDLKNYTQKLGEQAFDQYRGIPVIAKLTGADVRHNRLSYLAKYNSSEFSTVFPQFTSNIAASAPITEIRSETLLSAEDRFEKPYSQIVAKPVRELNDRVAERTASVEIQMEIDRLIAELGTIIFQYQNPGLQESDFRERESEFLQRLRSLYMSMPVLVKDDQPFTQLSQILKDLRSSRDRIYKAIEKADRQKDNEALKELNQQAVRNNRLVLKAQLLIAGKMLTGQSKISSKIVSLFAVRDSLRGALNSAQLLEEELGYRIGRLRAAERVREIETADWLGNIVRTFRMSGFDIKVTPSQEVGEEPQVTIRQQHWINVHTRLKQTLTDIRAGRIAAARERIDGLIAIYNVKDLIVYEKYQDIANSLRVVREKLSELTEGQVLAKGRGDTFAGDIHQLETMIVNPKQRVWVDVDFEDIGAAFRGYIHRFAGYVEDIGVISRNKTTLEFFAAKLKIAQKTRYLSLRNQTILLEGMAPIVQWAQRGFVVEKQRVVIDLQPAVEKIIKSDYEGAMVDILKAAEQLESRLKDIESIVANSKRQAASVFSAFRDKDIESRMATAKAAFKQKQFNQAFNQIGELIELYFNQDQIEPGYVRALRSLREVARLIRTAQRSRDPSRLIEQADAYFNLAAEDLTHKYSLKIYFVENQGRRTFVYVNPGTTIAGFIRSRGYNPRDTRVSFGQGWIDSSQFGLSLSEERTITINSKTQPPQSSVSSAVAIFNTISDIGDRQEVLAQVKRLIDDVKTEHYRLSFSNITVQTALSGQNPNIKYALAVDTSKMKVVGYVFFIKYPNGVISVFRLGVNENYRGISVGRQLMQNIFDVAREEGYGKVVLTTSADPENLALSFYEGLLDVIPGVTGKITSTEHTATVNYIVNASSPINSSVDTKTKGGIDFQADKLNLQTQSGGGTIKFEMTPEQLLELQNVPGFMPVIINIQPLKSVQLFLGLNTDTETQIPLYSQK